MNIGQMQRIGQFALNSWNTHNQKMSVAMQRLSSGKRINSAADDPAGFAISQKLRAQLRHLERSQLNTLDAISQTEMQDGHMQGMQNLLLRMGELATQASTGSYSDTDRAAMDAEYQQLMEEYNRIGGQLGNDSERKLFENTPPLKPGSPPSPPGEEIVLTGDNLNALLDGLDAFLKDINLAAKEGDSVRLKELGVAENLANPGSGGLRNAVLDFVRENGQRLLSTPQDEKASGGSYSLTLTDDNVSVRMHGITASSSGLAGTDLLNPNNAKAAMDATKAASTNLSKQRSAIGATYNRLEKTLSSLSNMEENLTASLSRIEDADMAKEMMEFTKSQALAQASTFVMAHTKQDAYSIVRLLQDGFALA